MIDEEKRRLEEKALLTGAKAFLAGEAGVIETARALHWLRDVRPELMRSVWDATGVDSETDALPIGEVRKHWKPEALARLEPEIAAAEAFHRDTMREACERIVRTLEART